MAEIAYIDESYDSSQFVMSALIVPEADWRSGFAHLQNYRRELKARHGIFTSKEFHATEFVAGRGRLAPKPIPKGLRAHLFKEYLAMLAGLLGAAIISGCWSMSGLTQREIHLKAFARIQERLQTRSVKSNSHIISIIDEGRATELQRIAIVRT